MQEIAHMSPRRTSGYSRQRGVTLMEILIAVVIVGLLAGIGYPSYQTFVRKSKRSDAHALLNEISAAQERFFSNTRAYTSDLQDLGYDQSASTASAEGFWVVSVDSAGATSFRLSATPTGSHSDDDCDEIILTGLGERRSLAHDAADDSDFNTTGTCW